MVWIHGGGNVEGSGAYTDYIPDMLVAEGVVVVTINYRLGALGEYNVIIWNWSENRVEQNDVETIPNKPNSEIFEYVRRFAHIPNLL